MNIFEYAMDMEKAGEEFYRELQEQSTDTGIATIFRMLAKAEAKHYQLFERMKADQEVETEDATVLDDVRNIFAARKAEGGTFCDPNATDRYVEAYRKAQQLEKQSVDFYLEKSEMVTDPKQKQTLLSIAEEEKHHYWILDNILEAVSRPDFGWIEFAEWHHSEEY